MNVQMQGSFYLDSLPLAERIYRNQPDLVARIYSDPIQRYLSDGVVILPDVIPLDVLDQLDRDLESLADLEAAPEILGSIELMAQRSIIKLDFCATLVPRISAKSPPGLKLVDLQRFFDSAKQLAFADSVTAFMAELFGSPAALIQSLTFWKSSEQSIHQDFSYVHHHR